MCAVVIQKFWCSVRSRNVSNDNVLCIDELATSSFVWGYGDVKLDDCVSSFGFPLQIFYNPTKCVDAGTQTDLGEFNDDSHYPKLVESSYQVGAVTEFKLSNLESDVEPLPSTAEAGVQDYSEIASCAPATGQVDRQDTGVQAHWYEEDEHDEVIDIFLQTCSPVPAADLPLSPDTVNSELQSFEARFDFKKMGRQLQTAAMRDRVLVTWLSRLRGVHDMLVGAAASSSTSIMNQDALECLPRLPPGFDFLGQLQTSQQQQQAAQQQQLRNTRTQENGMGNERFAWVKDTKVFRRTMSLALANTNSIKRGLNL